MKKISKKIETSKMFFLTQFILLEPVEKPVAHGGTRRHMGRHTKRNYCAGIVGKRVLNISGEPYLIQKGYIQRTSRGRIALEKAYQYLNYDKNNDLNLFNEKG